MTICQPIFAQTCHEIFNASNQKEKIRHIGYRGHEWDINTFRHVTQNDGLYAPLVHDVALRERVSLREAYEKVKFLEDAPKEILFLLLSRHVGYEHPNTPYISTSYKKRIAKRYSKAKTHEEVALNNPPERVHSVRFKISHTKTYSPLFVEFRNKNGFEIIQKILQQYKQFGKNSVEEIQNTINSLEGSLRSNKFSKKEKKELQKDLEKEKKSKYLLEWLIKHDWLNILFRVKTEKDAFSFFSETLKLISKDRNFLLPARKTRVLLRDGDSEVLLHIPASKIIEAQLFDVYNKLIEEK